MVNHEEIMHALRLDELVKNPELLGIEECIRRTEREKDMIDKNGSMVRQPDILYWADKGKVYVVEFTNGKKNTRVNGQLKREGIFLKEQGYDVTLIRAKYRRRQYRTNYVYI